MHGRDGSLLPLSPEVSEHTLSILVGWRPHALCRQLPSTGPTCTTSNPRGSCGRSMSVSGGGRCLYPRLHAGWGLHGRPNMSCGCPMLLLKGSPLFPPSHLSHTASTSLSDVRPTPLWPLSCCPPLSHLAYRRRSTRSYKTLLIFMGIRGSEVYSLSLCTLCCAQLSRPTPLSSLPRPGCT